jgi:ribosome recycling factor
MTVAINDTKDKMMKAIEALERELQSIRTGRANPGILDRIHANFYGSSTPLKNMANISVSEGRTLVIMPFDKSTLKDIEKAIQESDLGLTAGNDGNRILINIPELTGDRRKELAKLVGQEAEKAKVGIRNIRRDAMEHIKKANEGSEDDKKRHQDEVQKITDSFIQQVETITQAKEKEILTV